MKCAGHPARGRDVSGEVFDLQGRRLRRLHARAGLDGGGAVVWDGRDEQGRAASAGLYLVRLADGRSTSTIRTLLLH